MGCQVRKFTILLCVPLMACTGRVEVTHVARSGPDEPGAGGLPVLWIAPLPDHPLGVVTLSEEKAMLAIADIDTSIKEGIGKLRDSLRDPRARLRQAAVIALATATHPDGNQALVAAANDVHPVVRAEAKAQLAARPPTVRDAVFEQAIRAEDVDIATGAARIWPTLLDESEGLAARLKAAITDTSEPVAARIVGSHCGRAPIPEILPAVVEDERAGVKAAARTCAIEASPIDEGEPVQLLTALTSEDPATAALAATWLARIAPRVADEHHGVVSTALSVLAAHREPSAQIAIAAAQRAYGDDRGVDTLAVWIRAGNAAQRIRALAALYRLGANERVTGPTLVGALEPAFDDPDATIRVLAARVAGRTGDGRVAAPLSRLMSDREADVRATAAYAIAAAGAKLAVPSLIEPCLEDGTEAVRDACYAALHHLVHGYPLPPPDLVSEWLTNPGDTGHRPFWGRDWQRWRQWYQLER